MGLCTKDSLIVGFGMAPRGEVAMIVALIGLQQGIIGQDVYIVIILMSLLTTLITPIIYRNWFYRNEYCHISPSRTGEITLIPLFSPNPKKPEMRDWVSMKAFFPFSLPRGIPSSFQNTGNRTP